MCILSPQELDEHASNRCRGNAAAEAVATGLVSWGSILFSNLVLTESTHYPFKTHWLLAKNFAGRFPEGRIPIKQNIAKQHKACGMWHAYIDKQLQILVLIAFLCPLWPSHWNALEFLVARSFYFPFLQSKILQGSHDCAVLQQRRLACYACWHRFFLQYFTSTAGSEAVQGTLWHRGLGQDFVQRGHGSFGSFGSFSEC